MTGNGPGTANAVPSQSSGGHPVSVETVTYGKLVARAGGPTVRGLEHTLTSRSANLPQDLVDLFRVESLVPVDHNPRHMVEPAMHAKGALIVVPALRSARFAADRPVWQIAARFRPYPEGGVGQENNSRPTRLLHGWLLPADRWTREGPGLVGAMATELKAEPDEERAPNRFARGPHTVSVAAPVKMLVKDVPPATWVMLEHLCRGQPSFWSERTFPAEADFLKAVAALLQLAPESDVTLRGLISFCSGLAIGQQYFAVSYLSKALPGMTDSVGGSGAAKFARLKDAALSTVADQAAQTVRRQHGTSMFKPPSAERARIGHWEGSELAAEIKRALASGLETYV
ncbi:MAG: hypothetical protein ACREC6_01330 [Hyphomicrobiaceae bacterium]